MFEIFKIFILFLNIILSNCAPILDQWGRKITESNTGSTSSDLMVQIPLKLLLEKEAKITDLKKELLIANKKIDHVIIPLCVRHMATMIEDECPVAKSNVEIPKDTPFIATQDFTTNDISRTYRFLYIINNYQDKNMYVKTLYQALEKDFMTSNQLTKIDGMWISKFQTYKLDFCKSIVVAILHGNKLVAHKVNTGIMKEALSVYSPPVDRFITVFYNALLAHLS